MSADAQDQIPPLFSMIDEHMDEVNRREREAEEQAKVDGRVNNGGARQGAGRPRRKTITREDLMRQLKSNAADPIQFLIDVMMNDPHDRIDMKIDLDQRISCAKDLVGYIMPKLKSIELKPSDELLAGGVSVLRFTPGGSPTPMDRGQGESEKEVIDVNPTLGVQGLEQLGGSSDDSTKR